MKETFLIELTRNNGLPVGGGLFIPVIRPDLKTSTPYPEWNFSGDIHRMPEFAAPALGNRDNLVTIDAELPASANGCLYKPGSFAGGLTCYVMDGVLSYEYNLFEISRTRIKTTERLSAGRAKIEVVTKYVVERPGGPLEVSLRVNGRGFAKGTVPISAPVGFTANDCLNIGIALGSPVSPDYFDRAPFRFNGTIESVHVEYTR